VYYSANPKRFFMPRLDKSTKEQISSLSYSELKEIVLKLASKDKMVYEFVFVNYLDKSLGAKELFEKAKSDLDYLFRKGYKGYSQQLRLANMLSACVKRINEFVKVCKNINYEVDLLMYVLDEVFSLPENTFGTCFTQFDSKVGVLLKRVINVVAKKLHEDYRMDYADQINVYLKRLLCTSSHIDSIYNLP